MTDDAAKPTPLPASTREELVAENERLRRELAALSAGSFWADPLHGFGTADFATTVRRFRALMSSMDAIFLEVEPSGRVAGGSVFPKGFLGREASEIAQLDLATLVHPEERDALRHLLAADTDTTEHTFRFAHKDGQWRHYDVEMARPEGETGERPRLLFVRDVTAIENAVLALRESEDRFRALTENAKDLITELDGAGHLLYVSPTSVEVLGATPESLMGATFEAAILRDRVHPEDRDELLAGFRRAVAEGTRGGDRTYRIRTADGSWRWFESRARTYTNRAGELRAVVVSRDVTERVEAQRELEELEKRYAMLGATVRDLITETDPAMRLVYVSHSARQLLGYEPEELVGTLGRDLIHPDDAARVAHDFWRKRDDSDVSFTAPYRCRRKDGTYRWFEATALRYHRADGSGPWVIGLLRDVTERLEMRVQQRELEERVQRAQRLESLGIMAGGIAHDFNNLLTPILGQASLALMDLREGVDPAPRIEKVRTAARRAAKLTNQMLAYAGAGPMLFEATDVSELVREMGQLLESAASGRATIRFDLEPGLPSVEADGAQLSQVVMNMISNAVEAVGDGAGAITVRTHVLRGNAVAGDDVVVGTVEPDQRYVCFEVEDTGCGMDAATRARVFDPFFTTKFTGRGLGLAAVLGIVRGHDGAIELHSEEGRGTRFRVWLPPRGTRETATPEERAPAAWSASGTVLVADDDAGVLEVAAETLRRCGLDVVVAGNGAEAIERFDERPDAFHAVVLDRTMPQLGGDAAFARIRAIRPDVPIVLLSGYTEDSVGDGLRDAHVDGFLKKPFQPETLVEVVRRALAS
ncbi:MAG: PAS domain S-box protein [Myxococcota bacterium]